MNQKNAWRTVAVREIMVKLTDKSFIFSTLFSLAIIVVSIGAGAYFGNKTTDYTVGYTNQSAQAIIDSANHSLESSGSDDSLVAENFASEDEARAALEAEDIDALLAPADSGWELTYAESSDSSLTNLIEQSVVSTTTAANAAEQGISMDELTAGSSLKVETLKGEDNSFAAMMVGLAFAMIFYMAIIGFGVMIAQSVVEEKQNRIVEIIATAIPIRQLLIGKIVGNIVLAVGQIALYLIVGLTGANLMGALDEFGWVLSSAGWFVAFYIVGFATIATIWAAVGAMSSRNEDIASLSTPIMMLSMGALFGGIYASGTVLQVLSFIPIVSSIAMPMRLLTENVAFWEPLLALVLCAVAAGLLTVLGARIYQNNIMRAGSAVTWRQALKK